MAEKDFIIEEKTTEEKTTAETKEEVKEETPLEDVVLETEGGTKSLLGATSETGDIAATSLDTKTTPAGTDNLILFNQNTNVGYQIDYDNLADAILNKITSKTYTNQVGGSSAATLLAQLSTLNSNKPNLKIWTGSMPNETGTSITLPKINQGFLFINAATHNALYTLTATRCNKAASNDNSTSIDLATDGNGNGQTLTRENASLYLVMTMIYL